MPEIKPFRGILYDTAAHRPESVMAPPYDVIGPELREALYQRSPENIVRLILSKEADPYASAARDFAEWKRRGVLVQQPQAAIYLLAQTFELPDGKSVRRTGFIAACRLEEFSKGTVFPHEKTLAKPKEDRFRLVSAAHAMFSQIFSIYADPKLTMDALMEPWMEREPSVDLVYDGVRNTLWACDDPVLFLAASDLLRHQKVVVADGHHRYETALLYADAMRMKNPSHTGKEPYNFVPMFFANVHHSGLQIFPTHRVLHDLPGFDQDELLRRLGELFSVEQHPDAETLARALGQESRHAFGLLLPRSPKFSLLRWKARRVPGRAGEPEVVSQLDVSILHGTIFRTMLGLTEEMQTQKLHLDYVRTASEAVAAVAGGKAQAAFLMNATRIEQVRMVAESGSTMPQKSTYFYPKLLSGLVTYSFE